MKSKQLSNIILYTLGNLVSSFGSMVYSFAIGLYVLNSTGSGLSFAITLVVSFIPSLIITPFAGVLSDKFDKKKIVVLMDFLNGILFICFYFYIASFQINITSVYITAFLTNLITSFFGVAFAASKPQLVLKSNLLKLNSIDQLIHAGTAIISPILGGLIYMYVDIRLFILVNGISFLLSSFTEMFIDFNFSKGEYESNKDLSFKSIVFSLKEGFQHIIGNKAIMSTYSLFFGINILMSLAVQVPLPYILNTYLKVKPEMYGTIFSALPVGMIVGALIVGYFTKRYKYTNLFIILSLISGVLVSLIGLPMILPNLTSSSTSIFIFYAPIIFTFGIIISLIDVPFSTLIQTSVDESYLGRVWGILLPMIKIVNPIGFILAGVLIEFMNPYLIPLISGIVFIVFVLFRRNKLLSLSDETLDIETAV